MIAAVIEWTDAATSTTNWTHVDELDLAPRVVSTVGWILAGALKGHLVVAQSYDEAAGMVGEVLQIPVSTVLDVRKLE